MGIYSQKALLETLKAKAAEYPNIYPTWKRAFKSYPPRITRGQKHYQNSVTLSKDKTCYFCDTFDDFPADYLGTANSVLPRLPHGWYADNFQEQTVRPHVLLMRVKNRNGKKELVYLAGVDYSDWDGVIVFVDIYHDCQEDAARAANYEAERIAEQCREDDARYQAEQQIEEKREELHQINKKTIALIKELKRGLSLKISNYPAICATVHESIQDAIEEKSEIYAKIAELKDNYWSAVY